MKALFVLLVSLVSIRAISQDGVQRLLVDDKLNIDSFYKDKANLLIMSEVIQCDSLSKAILFTKSKSWASTAFVNLKEVLVGETEDQIVLNFIDKSYYTKSLGMKYNEGWYFRLVIQFKDGKVKYSLYDDGNTAVLPSQYSNGAKARTYNFTTFFKDDEGQKVARRATTDGLLALYQSLETLVNSLKVDLTKKTKDNDW